jgi:hypothetical protein
MASAILSVNGGFLSAAECSPKNCIELDTAKKESSGLASLMLTKDFFKKIIVRMDIPHNFYDENGIFHCSLIDLLLGRVELF